MPPSEPMKNGTRDDCAVHASGKVRAIVANGASRVTFSGKAAEVPADLHRYIDHTLLKPEATEADIDRISVPRPGWRS